MTQVAIRPSVPGDRAGIEALYPAAFPDEDLLPLLRELLPHPSVAFSLVAEAGMELVGHVVFTGCPDKVALLGPLAVAPARQKQGIGKALVNAGLERLERSGWVRVLVLGDPAYYGRLGFTCETGVEPPYELPSAWRTAWQAKELGGPHAPPRGRLAVPPPWNRRALWAP
jgi:putative acetyltransferase